MRLSTKAETPLPKGARSRSTNVWVFVGLSSVMLFSAVARAEPCQNQAAIDVCKFGCNATSDVCGALCGAAVDTCTGVCIGGCAVSCAIDCCAGFCTGSDACHDCIGGCENTCRNGCQLDCDDCILNCNRDCESICVPFRKAGEFCTPLFDRCADGLTCWPLPFPGELRPRCFPPETDRLIADDECRSFYSSAVHEAAMAEGLANSYGIGSSAGVVIAGSFEEGVVYGADGRFGCYFTTCIGALSDASFGSYAGIGFYLDYDEFYGNSVVIVETVGKGINFSTAQVLSTDGRYIGTTDALSIGVGGLPADVGVYYCTTLVDTVGTHNPDGTLAPVTNTRPLALCKTDLTICARSDTCDTELDLDDGSIDPDGDPLTLTQSPAGPYALGEHEITLTARDPDGVSHSCTEFATVVDCDSPVIVCPDPIVVRCENENGTTEVDPGQAVAEDCSAVEISDPEAAAFPLGTTIVTHVATDEAGFVSSCEQEITVDEPDTDGDGVVDCMDRCPLVQVFSPSGCGAFFAPGPVPADSDGDGVTDENDQCPGTDPGTTVDESGCPIVPVVADSDNDSVNDDADQCPDTPAGTTVDADGCPVEAPPEQPLLDSDGDGVNDADDVCPDTPAGAVVSLRGCPSGDSPDLNEPDSDGDGVLDADDDCAGTPAGTTVDANGCPPEANTGRPSIGNGFLRIPCGPVNGATLMLTLLGLTALSKKSRAARGVHRTR